MNDGGNAFPYPLGTMNAAEPSQSGGMSLRDYFAAVAAQGYLAGDTNPTMPNEIMCRAVGLDPAKSYDWDAAVHYPKWIANRAYAIADAMLKARMV